MLIMLDSGRSELTDLTQRNPQTHGIFQWELELLAQGGQISNQLRLVLV